MTAFVDPLMAVWAVVSVWVLMTIFAYEYLIVGVTIEDIEAEVTPIE